MLVKESKDRKITILEHMIEFFLFSDYFNEEIHFSKLLFEFLEIREINIVKMIFKVINEHVELLCEA